MHYSWNDISRGWLVFEVRMQEVFYSFLLASAASSLGCLLSFYRTKISDLRMFGFMFWLVNDPRWPAIKSGGGPVLEPGAIIPGGGPI